MSRLNKLVHGVGWQSISTVGVVGFQLVFAAVMARRLDPADFGLVAIAHVSLQFFRKFSELGVQPAIIRKDRLDDGDVRAALFISLGMAAALFLISFLLAPVFEAFFDMRGLAVVIRVLALSFIIGGFSTVSLGIMYRKTMFKDIALLSLFSQILGYGLFGLGAAFLGQGVWALVIGTLSQLAIAALWAYAVTRHPLGVSCTAEKRAYFLKFGGMFSVIGFMEFLTSFLGDLMVGKLFGPSAAGIYNRSTLLAQLPVHYPVSILHQSLFPIVSSLRTEHPEKYYYSLLYGVLLVGSLALAISVGIFIAAADIVSVLLGDKWLAVIPVLQVFVFAVPLNSMTQVLTLHFESSGQLRTKLVVQSVMLVALVTLSTFLYPYGLQGIATAVVLAEAIRLVPYAIIVVSRLNAPVRDILVVFSILTLVGIVVAMCMSFAVGLMPASFPAMVKLPLEILTGVLALCLAAGVVLPILMQLPAYDYLQSRFPFMLRLRRP